MASPRQQESIVWRKSTASGGTNCVEVSFGETLVHVRDSKDRGGPVLSFTRPEWMAFLAGAREGGFGIPGTSAQA
jgi:Domain of unknown function (DUF397)